MKQLIILTLLTALLTITSFAQDSCENYGLCDGLVVKAKSGICNKIDTLHPNFYMLNLDLCDGFKLKIDTNNILPNIAFIKNYFPLEDLTICEENTAKCVFFMSDSESQIAEYGLETATGENLKYTINENKAYYILQKDSINCRVFKLNIKPIEENISFNLYQNDCEDFLPSSEISYCPPITLKAKFNNEKNPEDFSYQWKKNDSIISNESTDNLIINSIGEYEVTITSNLTQCQSTKSVDFDGYKDTFSSFPFEYLGMNFTDKDTINTCIGNNVELSASFGPTLTGEYSTSYEAENYGWDLNDQNKVFTLNFTPTSATTINDTLRFTSTSTSFSCDSYCAYKFAVPVIQVFAPPTISDNDIKLTQPESCVGSGRVTIELSDTSNIQYQLNLDGAESVEFQDTNVFENVSINSNYSIVIAIVINNKTLCTATSEAFSIQYTGTAVSPNIKITNAKEIPGEPLIACVGAEINFEISNTDSIETSYWNDEPNASFMYSFLPDTPGDTLVKLAYNYLVEGEDRNCKADTTILISVQPLPEPTVILTTNENLIIEQSSNNTFDICDGENFTLSTEDYISYVWELNNETDTTNSILTEESIRENTEFTLTVTDSNGCKSELVSGVIRIVDNEDSAVKIREEHPAQIDTIHTLKFCKGSKAIYKYESNDEHEFEITPIGNNKISTHKNESNKFIIVEWNTSAALSLKASNNDSTNRCAGNEIPVIVNDEAPTGTIESFGNNSNTFILNHNNETIDNYQWFTIDEDGAYSELTEFANERIIDCSLTNCDTTTKILGLKITTNNCSNLILKEDLLITNITELSANNIFNISPTVNSGEFYLTLNSINPLKQYLLSIYNISGQSVYATAIKSTNSNFISVSPVPPGVYLAVIKEGKQPIAQQKLIIY